MSNQIKISPSDIIDRYNNAFGYTAMKITPRLRKMGFNKVAGFMNPNVYENVDSSFAEMVFTSSKDGKIYNFGIDTTENGSPALPFVKEKPSSQGYMAPPPMISFSRDKHVVVTAIDGSNDEVIENFGTKSYKFILKGILVDTYGHQYPSDLLKAVHKMFGASGTYKVESDIFADLDIDEVFFESGFKVDFVEGYVDTVMFQVTGRSVNPAEITME